MAGAEQPVLGRGCRESAGRRVPYPRCRPAPAPGPGAPQDSTRPLGRRCRWTATIGQSNGALHAPGRRSPAAACAASARRWRAWHPAVLAGRRPACRPGTAPPSRCSGFDQRFAEMRVLGGRRVEADRALLLGARHPEGDGDRLRIGVGDDEAVVAGILQFDRLVAVGPRCRGMGPAAAGRIGAILAAEEHRRCDGKRIQRARLPNKNTISNSPNICRFWQGT